MLLSGKIVSAYGRAARSAPGGAWEPLPEKRTRLPERLRPNPRRRAALAARHDAGEDGARAGLPSGQAGPAPHSNRGG